VKPTLGLTYANLPYFIEQDAAGGVALELTQSNAILRYIGRKHGLAGATPAQGAIIDMTIDQLVDARGDMSRSNYSGSPSAADVFAKSLPPFLAQFEGVLGRDGYKWIAGADLSIADFVLYELLVKARAFGKEAAGIPDALAAYPRLAALLAQFEALPAIAAALADPAYMHRPFNNKVALWT
jgi:glutathione S-transferase